MISEVLKNSIEKSLASLGIDKAIIPEIHLEHPDNLSYGDYSTNIALSLAKLISKNPRELAEKICQKIKEEKLSEIIKVEVAGAGFINFFLPNEFFVKEIFEISKKGDLYGNNIFLNRQKTIVEYTDPNPFKEFHIGHLMSNSIGEAISRIVEANGAEVVRACYQGDVGLHVAKTIWGVNKMISDKPENKKEFFGGLFGIGKNPKVWGKAYSLGATTYEENESIKKEIIDINKKIYEHSDSYINKIYKIGKEVSLREFEKIYKILGTKFKEYFFESETGEFGKKVVLENIENGIFEKSDGAVIFRGEKYGLHTRVFINSEGLPTYEAKDLGLSKIKYNRYQYDKSIVITGNEINEYFKVLLKTMSLIFPDLASKTLHMSHGMLRLPSGKMSSRTGKVITAESLLDELEKTVSEKIADRKINEKEKKIITEYVSVAALKYSILKQTTGKDIIFDLDKSLSFEGDSGPYLQYSYARAKAVLRKGKEFDIQKSAVLPKDISELEKHLIRFPEIVARAGIEYSPNLIASYLIHTASLFNGYYEEFKIVDKNDKNSSYRLVITEAFSIVMKNGLNLLGIRVLEKM